MIRPYEKGDELRLDANEFSSLEGLSAVFEDDSFVKHTLDDDGEIKCIL